MTHKKFLKALASLTFLPKLEMQRVAALSDVLNEEERAELLSKLTDMNSNFQRDAVNEDEVLAAMEKLAADFDHDVQRLAEKQEKEESLESIEQKLSDA